MNRLEFMTELTTLLQDMPAEEREEALQYYNDYFEDAGMDRENEVIQELESPKRVADMLHADFGVQNEENCEYRETGYADTRFESYEHPATKEPHRRGRGQTYSYSNEHTEVAERKPWTNKWLKLILIILIICIGAPVLIPITIGILGALFGIIVAAVAAVAGILIAGVAIVVAGVLVLFAAVPKAFVSVPAAFAYAGIGFLMIAIGAVIAAFTWWIAWKIIPPVVRGIVSLCKRIFSKNRKGAQV